MKQQEKLLKAILKWQPRTPKQLEASNNCKQYFRKRKKRIQILQSQSIPNLIYIFPRTRVIDSESSSISDTLETLNQETLMYSLPQQNRRNRSYQYSSQVFHRNTSVVDKTSAREWSKEKQELYQSFRRQYFNSSLSKQKKNKQETPSKNNNKKRKKTQEKTLINSSKRLVVAQQFSLDANQNNINTKKSSQNATLSCRWKPPKLRTKTEYEKI